MIDFTDAELNVILTLAVKGDPMELIAECKSIKEKIQEYAEGQQAEQIEKAAKAKVGED